VESDSLSTAGKKQQRAVLCPSTFQTQIRVGLMNSKCRFIPYQTIVCNYGIKESELIQSCFTMLQAFSLLLVLNSTSKAHLASALEHQMLCSLYSSDLVTNAIL